MTLRKDLGHDMDGIMGQWQKNDAYIDYPDQQSVIYPS